MLAVRTMMAVMLFLAVINWRTLASKSWELIDSIFAGLLLSFVLSALFSSRTLYSFSEWWHLGGFYALGWLIYRLRPGAAECLTLARVAGALGLIAALYGFLTYIGYDILRPLYPFKFDENQGGRNFIHSFYGNPEYFGGVAAPTSVILLGLGYRPGIPLYRRGICIALAMFIVLVLLLSGTRGALFGFMAGALIVFLGQIRLLPQQLRKTNWAAMGTGIILVLIGLVIFSTPNALNRRDMRLAQRFTTLFDFSSASTRERLLFYTSSAMAIPENFVFGYGPGSYRLEFYNNVKMLVDEDPKAGTTALLNDLNRRLAEHTHNDYLEFWFEQGTIGIALFLLLIVHATVRFVRLRWQARRVVLDANAGQKIALFVTLFAAAVTMLINALTSFPLHMPARATLAWMLIGAFFSAERMLNDALINTRETQASQPRSGNDKP